MFTLVNCILALVIDAALASDSSNSTYRWTDEVTGEPVTCSKCPPGTFVRHHCTRGAPTICEGCPHSHYTALPNYIEECLYCDYPCSAEQHETRACAPTHNRECECNEGYYLRFGFCMRHKACPVSEGVIGIGTAYQNTLCAPCPEGFFSSLSSTTEACQKHSDCPATKTAVRGNSKQDTFCTTCRTDASTAEGQAECNQEALEFLLQQKLSAKGLRRLQRELVRRTRGAPPHSGLRVHIALIQSAGSAETFLPVLLDVLEKARLHNLYRRVKHRFLVSSTTERP